MVITVSPFKSGILCLCVPTRRSAIHPQELAMNQTSSDIGVELLALLRLQRYLYHQLRALDQTQHQLAAKTSPELLLEVIAARRKLVQKLQQLDAKLRTIKANWQTLAPKITPEQKAEAKKMAAHVRDILHEIENTATTYAGRNLSFNENCRFHELFVEPLSPK
jgi:hypothetical protein